MTKQQREKLVAIQQNAQFLSRKINELIAIELLENDLHPDVLSAYGATIEEVASCLLNNLRLLYAERLTNNDTDTDAD